MLGTHTHAPARTQPSATCCSGNRVEIWRERLYDKNGSAGRGGKILAVRTCKDEEGINGGMSRKPGGGGVDK